MSRRTGRVYLQNCPACGCEEAHDTKRAAIRDMARIVRNLKRCFNRLYARPLVPVWISLTIEGGVLQAVQVDSADNKQLVSVNVYDFDTEGADPEKISKSPKGDDCLASLYEFKGREEIC